MRPIPVSVLLVPYLAVVLASFADQARADRPLSPPGILGDLTVDQGVPQPGEGPFPYVIVTGRALRSEFLALARERVRNGIPSRVRSLESLRSDYPAAADDPERVRLFLRDAHLHWGARWVLLGGDTDVIPPRYASVNDILGNRSFVSDWYYACLDGTWDADGDGRYGEPVDPSTGDPGDAPDLDPELFVGRAPVSDHQEARGFVRKTLAYQSRPADGFEHTTLLFANRLAPFFDLAAGAEVLLPMIADDSNQVVTRLYESWDDPAWTPGALPETRASVLAALGEGHNVVIGFGGGGTDRLEAGERTGPNPQYLTVPDVMGLANGDRAGHVWLLTSLVSAFDHPTSLAEAFLRAPGGGAVTVIAPSDLTFVSPAFTLIRGLVEEVFQGGVGTVGEALVRARAPLASAPSQAAFVMAYQLLGDPLLPVLGQGAVASAGPGPDHGRTGITGIGRSRPEGPATDLTTGLDPAATQASEAPESRGPQRLVLSSPVPSPALSSVRVECDVPGDAAGVALEAAIVDVAGRVVRTFDRETVVGGVGTVRWDLRDARGRRVSPGVYFLSVRAAGASRTTRLVVAPGP